jgi:CTP synthase
VQPDILVCRTEHPLNDGLKNKIALFCNVDPAAVIESIDTDTIYNVPVLMREERLDQEVLKKMNIPIEGEPELGKWEKFLERMRNPSGEVTIALVGKYVELKDSYKSIIEALHHAGVENDHKVRIRMVHSETVEYIHRERSCSRVSMVYWWLRALVPAVSRVRLKPSGMPVKTNIPFLGVCLGMQCAVIEFARNVLGLSNAHSLEMDPQTPHPVIDLMEEQKRVEGFGGTMRLGGYRCQVKTGSHSYVGISAKGNF